MHKKLEADLISLAHSILQMKNKENVFLLKQKSKEIYEKLAVLAFVEEYVNATPNLEETKEEVLFKIEKAFENKNVIEEKIEAKEETVVFNLEADKPEILEQPFDELEEVLTPKPVKEKQIAKPLEVIKKEIVKEKKLTLEEVSTTLENIKNSSKTEVKKEEKVHVKKKALTLEEELQDTIPVDIMANLFEPAKPKSLNDRLQNNIQIGLNDRIVFVKNLFNGSQEDFNRVISQLNTLKTEKEAKKFINKMVKPDYNWAEHEELEIRFMEIIERRFA